MKFFPALLLAAAVGLSGPPALQAQPQMEKLGRGLVALPEPDGRVAVSWRLLGSEPADVAFNLYRQSEPPPLRVGGRGGGRGGRGGPGGAAPGGPVKLNPEPLTGPTFFVDDTASLATKTSYFVRSVLAGVEQAPSAAFTLPAGAPPLPYLSVPLQTPADSMPGDASAADLDGDGELDLVVKFEQRPRDNSQGGPTGETRLQGYKLDASPNGFTSRLLWTINLGHNIREGAHYTQFQVYDYDGDGRAELICKTADGTVDGTGKVIGDPHANWVQPVGATARIMAAGRGGVGPKTERTETLAGHILSGPEYLTVFDGLTGAALATTDYQPARVAGTTALDAQALHDTWGDARGNRSDRFLAGTAYLDGVHPSVVMCRGYYTRTTLAA